MSQPSARWGLFKGIQRSSHRQNSRQPVTIEIMIIATIEDDRYTYYITEEMRKYRMPEPRITKNFIKQ